jgi:hypothetical protein
MATSTETDPPTEPSPVRRRYILDNVETLGLGLEGISTEDAIQLAKELAINTTLKVLDLDHQHIQPLVDLGLDGDRIGDVGMEALGEALTRNGSFKKFSRPTNRNPWPTKTAFVTPTTVSAGEGPRNKHHSIFHLQLL